jgi:transcription initiation factor TFIID TATA-box-binding protein
MDDVEDMPNDDEKARLKIEEEEEAKMRMFAESKLTINNNVFTTKIVMDENAHPSDPRILREEDSTYIPPPFAAYMAALKHVRTKRSVDREEYRLVCPEDVIEDEHPSSIARRDIYVFAMLAGLRSMWEESSDPAAKIAEARGKRPRTTTTSSIRAWNDDSKIEADAVRAISMAERVYGAKKYCTPPYNKFDLVDLVRRMDGRSARCIPPRFAAVIVRFKYPSTSVSVFSPGKVVCTGARTEAVGHYAIMETLCYLRKKGFPRAQPLSNSLEAENVVGTFKHNFGLDIEKLHRLHPDIVSYNKEAFPGATVRPSEIFPAAQLAFESGNIVTMGGRNPRDLERALGHTFGLYYSVRKELPKKKKKNNRSRKRKGQ